MPAVFQNTNNPSSALLQARMGTTKMTISATKLAELNDNPYIRYATDSGICLSSGLLVAIYKSWLGSPTEETIHQGLADASLDLDSLELSASGYLNELFMVKGEPAEDVLLLVKKKQPHIRKNRKHQLGYDDILLRSGKFVRRTKGIGLEKSFEEELFRAYPEQSIEDGLRNVGIDPKIVGSYRIAYIRSAFDKKLYSTESVHSYLPETVEGYAVHPYVQAATPERLVLRQSFFNDAASLSELPIEKVLSVFEFEPDLFDEKESESIRNKLLNWEASESIPVAVNEVTVKILQNRMKALQEVQDMRWKALGETIPSLTPTEKKDLFTKISIYAKNLGTNGELSRILQLVGVPRSSFYGCLKNEEYGQAKLMKERQDEEDAAKIRMVFEYKGFKKGVRLIQMMLPSLAGVSFSIKKVRRLMRKFGMDCGVRAPNSAKRRSKEYMETHVKKNLLKRRFRLGRPNKYRLTDVTYLDFGKPDANGKKQRAYGSAMIDSVSGRLVAMNLSMHNDEDLVMETLRLSREYPWIEGGVIHSDQGVLYLSDEFQDEVRAMGLDQSMSKRGNSQDNAPMESFFGHAKDEVDYAACASFTELKNLFEEYAEYYNNERPMADRLRMTPAAYEEYLLAMDDEEFASYLAGEEEKYQEKKARAKELAIARAKTLGIEDITEGMDHGEDGSGNE